MTLCRLPIAILSLALAGSCSPERKDSFMRTFFDGYPPESEARSASAETPASQPAVLASRAPSWAETVSTTHADFAEDCNTCHSPTRVVTSGMCMGCHDGLEIHGGATKEQFARCGTCHREHRGREAKLIPTK